MEPNLFEKDNEGDEIPYWTVSRVPSPYTATPYHRDVHG
jgi:hypothetical protein